MPAFVPVHRRCCQRHDLGRSAGLLGDGVGRADYSLARISDFEDGGSGTSDCLSDRVGVGADRDRHVRAAHHLQRNGARVLHGIDTVCHLPTPFEGCGATPGLLQSRVSDLTRRPCRRNHIDRRFQYRAETGRSSLWSRHDRGRTAFLSLLEMKEPPD